MDALLLVGHGSLRKASGTAMLRLADHLRERGVAPIVAAGFLNFSQPTFAEAIQDCVDAGATRVAVQPYLLIDGFYSRRLLPRLLAEARAAHPDLHLTATAPLGFHPALISLVSDRARASLADAPALPTGLLIMAHGTPFANANAPIEQLARELENRFASVAVGYLELNDPSIPAAAADLVLSGVSRIVALPYFLHLGEHVATDLPLQLQRLRERYLGIRFHLAEQLGYDPLIADIIEDRVAEVRAGGRVPTAAASPGDRTTPRSP